jgi:hypothetical protein
MEEEFGEEKWGGILEKGRKVDVSGMKLFKVRKEKKDSGIIMNVL